MLDIENANQLLAYLRSAGHIANDESPRFETLHGGVSNRTVLVTRPNGEAWVLKQALEKLRVQVDWFSPPERVHREADGLRWLEQLAPIGTTTPLLFEDFEHHLIAMAAVPTPHQNWKTMLLAGDLELDHVEQFARLLATVEIRSALRKEELLPVFGDRGYFESLRLEPYYVYTSQQAPESEAFYNALLQETRARRDTLVHGDYSPKNILVHDDHLVLLDHEVVHFGDPGFDLGFSMTHLLSKAHHLPDQREEFVDAARHYWETYWNSVDSESWTDGLESRAVRHTLGCLLARVRGRSPLEYLDPSERDRQTMVVVTLMHRPPITMIELIRAFTEEIASLES